MKTNKILVVLVLSMLITAVSMISAVSAGNQNNARDLLITDEIINSKNTIMTLTEKKTKDGSMEVDVNYMGIDPNGHKTPMVGGNMIVKIQQGDNGVLIITTTKPSLPPGHGIYVDSVESDLTAEDYYYNVYKPELIYKFLTKMFVYV